jgi:hypothetical protein
MGSSFFIPSLTKTFTKRQFISTKSTKFHEDPIGYKKQMIHPKGCCCFGLKNLFFLVFLRVLRGQLLFLGSILIKDTVGVFFNLNINTVHNRKITFFWYTKE